MIEGPDFLSRCSQVGLPHLWPKIKGFCAGDLFGGRDSREQEWLTGKVKWEWKEVTVWATGALFTWGPSGVLGRTCVSCPPEVSRGKVFIRGGCLSHWPGFAGGIDCPARQGWVCTRMAQQLPRRLRGRSRGPNRASDADGCGSRCCQLPLLAAGCSYGSLEENAS